MEVQSVLVAPAADAGKLPLAARPGKAAPRTSRSRLTASACRESFERIRHSRLFEIEFFQVDELEVEAAKAEDGELANEAALSKCAAGVAMGKSLLRCEILGVEKEKRGAGVRLRWLPSFGKASKALGGCQCA
jgi:hypothetical protein